MQENLRRFNVVQIIGNIALFVNVILLAIFKTDFLTNLFWTLIPLCFLGNVSYINKWSNEGRTFDKEKDTNYMKNLTRKYSEKLVFLMVGFTLIYCILIFAEYFAEDIRINIYVIIGFYLFVVLFEYVIYKIVATTKEKIKDYIK